MPRVKRGTMHVKRRQNILKKVRGFSSGRKNLIKQAKTALTKAGAHAYTDRRLKKRTFRQLWNIKINAGTRKNGISYSVFIHKLIEHKSILDRKSLAHLAEHYPMIFGKIVEKVK